MFFILYARLVFLGGGLDLNYVYSITSSKIFPPECVRFRYLTGMVDKRTLEKYEREAKEKNRETW